MPSNQYDANIKLLYIVDDNSFFASDSLTRGEPFDVIGNVEIGKELMENVETEKLFISVINLSKARLVATGKVENHLEKAERTHNAELRVNFPGGWDADDGDVLEAVASYRVSTGLFTDYSTLRTLPVVVAARHGRM
jgi:hypothetical protein